ncbi:MAG: ABC transporter ATP-binding protein [Betaproteobacteria bacterium]|nr:ABC transporter ATP-binding protein [Betaproteobacteria bacterium]
MADEFLDIVGLTKRFGALRATDAFSLQLIRGETHALIGPNGAGKTTLIAQISGELRPDEGEIRFLGESVSGLPIQDRVERGLARSFQITSIFAEFTALQNVSLAVQATQGHSFRWLGRPEEDEALNGPARTCLALVDLERRADEPAAALSHGEHRQLEIAMALALKPKLILLDEPMAGMGREDSRRMASLLQGLKAEVSMLLVEHDMDVVFSLSDRVTVMVNGAAIATGSPREIQQSAAVRRAYLGGV